MPPSLPEAVRRPCVKPPLCKGRWRAAPEGLCLLAPFESSVRKDRVRRPVFSYALPPFQTEPRVFLPRCQSKAQRSGFALERRNSGASELSDPSGSERCKACSDEELLLTGRSLSKERKPQTGRFMPSCLYEKEPPPGSPSRCQYSTSECAIPCHPAPTAFMWHKWNNWHSIFPKTLKYPYIPYIPCAVRLYLTLS